MKKVSLHVKTEGFEGIFYSALECKERAVIVLTGSGGGIKTAKESAQLYAENGIPALAVALFYTEETEADLDQVPMEYVESATHWLQKKGYQSIAIDGRSKGSELALLSAVQFSAISCVIVRVPSYFVSEGLLKDGDSKRPSGASCWSYQGEEIPFSSYGIRDFSVLKRHGQMSTTTLYDINNNKRVSKESIIPVERIQGPILLLSTLNDTVWPSYENAVYIENRLIENHFPYPHHHVIFQKLNHAMSSKKIGDNEDEAYERERKQLCSEIIHWVKEVW